MVKSKKKYFIQLKNEKKLHIYVHSDIGCIAYDRTDFSKEKNFKNAVLNFYILSI